MPKTQNDRCAPLVCLSIIHPSARDRINADARRVELERIQLELRQLEARILNHEAEQAYHNRGLTQVDASEDAPDRSGMDSDQINSASMQSMNHDENTVNPRMSTAELDAETSLPGTTDNRSAGSLFWSVRLCRRISHWKARE